MAGNKTVPLKWGEGGPVIGSASIDENGLITAEIENETVQRMLFVESGSISIYTPNAKPGNAIG